MILNAPSLRYRSSPGKQLSPRTPARAILGERTRDWEAAENMEIRTAIFPIGSPVGFLFEVIDILRRFARLYSALHALTPCPTISFTIAPVRIVRSLIIYWQQRIPRSTVSVFIL